MLGEEKNFKDTSKDSIKDTSSVPLQSNDSYPQSRAPLVSSWTNITNSYSKTNKLITALYMVTDIMDKDEPIRLKLRTFGVEILSDTASLSKGDFGSLEEKIITILSFLNIAFDMGMISEMNHNILRKEFVNLKRSFQDLRTKNNLWLEDFMMSKEEKEEGLKAENDPYVSPVHNISQAEPNRKLSMSFIKGQPTRIGVQKGSTLMKALQSVREKHARQMGNGVDTFEVLKSKRREEIVAFIKDKKRTTGIDGATITDIKKGAKGSIASCGEKTLQRELVSMVSDNILYRTGSKRWSIYFIKKV